jgi:hypothetical protein
MKFQQRVPKSVFWQSSLFLLSPDKAKSADRKFCRERLSG